MINRRIVLAGAAALAFSASAASAQDWKAKYPELVFAKVPDENASGTSDRWTPLTEYLSRELYDLEANDVMGEAPAQTPGEAAIPALGSAAA